MSPAMITEVMVLSTRLGQLAESTEAPLSDKYISVLEAQNRDLQEQGEMLHEYITRLELLFPQLMNQLQPTIAETCNKPQNAAQESERKVKKED
jgi:hypothetical protein